MPAGVCRLLRSLDAILQALAFDIRRSECQNLLAVCKCSPVEPTACRSHIIEALQIITISMDQEGVHPLLLAGIWILLIASVFLFSLRSSLCDSSQFFQGMPDIRIRRIWTRRFNVKLGFSFVVNFSGVCTFDISATLQANRLVGSVYLMVF